MCKGIIRAIRIVWLETDKYVLSAQRSPPFSNDV